MDADKVIMKTTPFHLAAHLVVAVLLLCSFSSSSNAQSERAYTLATATTGGTYYPVGVALATLTKVKLKPQTGISLSAISSAGSAENIKLLREDQAQFALLQGIYGAWAWAGEGPIEASGPQTHLRAVTQLWLNVEHFVLLKSLSKTGMMADLANLEGVRFSIGKRYSGTEGSTSHILKALGIDSKTHLSPVYKGYGPSAEGLQNRTLSGLSTPAGPPVAAITRVFASMGSDLTLLGFSPEDLTKVNAHHPLWQAYTIEAGTYPGQSQPVQTIANPNILAVRADVDDDAVYAITKTIYENLGFLGQIHKATKTLSLETATQNLPFPVHPGAQAYYDDVAQDNPLQDTQ